MIRQRETEKLPAAPLPPGYRWRPARLEDMPALHRLLLATAAADGRDRVDSLADLQTQFNDPWSDPEHDSRVGFTAAGQMALFARCFAHPAPESECRAHLWLEVHPDHRQADLEAAALDWLEARGRARLQAAPAQLPRSLRMGLPDTLTRYRSLLQQRGFQPVRYFCRMRRDLRQPIPQAPLPAGIAFRVYTPEYQQPMLEAFNESFGDHWGFQTITHEDWDRFFIQRSSFRPDLSWLALQQAEMVGFSYNTVDPAENERLGIQQGWIGDLGVRRPWRRRGIATALLCQSMRAFKAEALDYAALAVDTENPTGALGLYERLGFVPYKRFTVYEKAMP